MCRRAHEEVGPAWDQLGQIAGTALGPAHRAQPHHARRQARRLAAPAYLDHRVQVARMSEEQAEATFKALRWRETDGEPVCPACGCPSPAFSAG